MHASKALSNCADADPTPPAEKRKVYPSAAGGAQRRRVRRKPPRDWLHQREIEALITAAGRHRHAERDRALVLICYRHGLRVGELFALEWAHVDFHTGLLVVLDPEEAHVIFEPQRPQ